jgi:hypothetical protein
VRMVSRILEKHPTSLPLIILRAHCQLIQGQYPAALRNYFKVLCPACFAAVFCVMRVIQLLSWHSGHTVCMGTCWCVVRMSVVVVVLKWG